MKVGIQIGLTDVDQIAEHCRQMGVDRVVLSARSVPGFTQQGYIKSDNAKRLKEAVHERGIQVSGLIPPNPSREAVLGGNEAEVEALCKTIRAMGEADIKLALFYPLDRFKNYKEEYHHQKPPLEVMPGEEKWDTIIQFFRRVADIAEELDMKIANHVFAVDVMREILDTVGSPSLGVTYCPGMYMFGADPYAGVDIYGIERIFLCHARNLVRHGPGRQGHEEVRLEDGDIDFARFIRNLMEAGYDGLIIPEHLGKAGEISDSVAYLKKLIGEISDN